MSSKNGSARYWAAMSEANVEIVRAAIDSFNRQGDWASVFEQYATPHFQLDMSRSIAPQRGVYGREQTPGVLGQLTEGFESVKVEPHEFIELGEQIVVPLTAHMVGRQGIEVEARTTWTWTIRDGAVERVCLYQDRAEALNAAGLSE
jgi:ketosteroid isomerase-like protein